MTLNNLNRPNTQKLTERGTGTLLPPYCRQLKTTEDCMSHYQPGWTDLVTIGLIIYPIMPG